MRTERHDNLTRVVELARKVLADLAPDQVPGRLVQVAAQTGRFLVPPMQRRLIHELEGNEWFREQVAERFDGEVEAEDPLEKAAALFLHRPEGWENDLRELSQRSQLAEQSDRIETMARCIDDLKTELETWRNQAKRNRRQAEEAAARADRRVAVARREARAHRDDGCIKELQRENRAIREKLERSETGRLELQDRLEEVRAELRRERRVDRSVDRRPTPSAWATLDLVDSARLLDDVVEAFSPDSAFRESMVAGERSLELPSGVSPDDRSAIEWLLTVERDFVLMVDGYNVGYLLNPSRFSSPEVRRRLENDLARLKGLALRTPRVVVVYDSDQSGDTTRDPGPSGLEIRFTRTGHSADDEILSLAADLGATAVVVSTDRRVREGSEESGSLGLWSQSLAGWILDS